ncbi:hypothetical protein FHS96_005854 [Sphingomonas zeicaulis]
MISIFTVTFVTFAPTNAHQSANILKSILWQISSSGLDPESRLFFLFVHPTKAGSRIKSGMTKGRAGFPGPQCSVEPNRTRLAMITACVRLKTLSF